MKADQSARFVIDVAEVISLRRPDAPDLVLGAGLSTVRWFQERFCASWGSGDDAGFAELSIQAEGVPDGSAGVLFVPLAAQSSFFGMSYQTDLAQCTRAVYEGLTHASVAVLLDAGVHAPSFVLDAPSVGNSLWQELFAKSLGVPVAADSGTYEPGQRGIQSQTSLHALYSRCLAAMHGLEGVA
jgi:sugar (pentulose or hexulose) kinase